MRWRWFWLKRQVLCWSQGIGHDELLLRKMWESYGFLLNLEIWFATKTGPCQACIGEKVKWAVTKTDGRKSEQSLREKTEFLWGNIKHLLVSNSYVPGICRNYFVWVWDILESSHKSDHWRKMGWGDFTSNTLGFFWWYKQNPDTIKILFN